MVTVVLVDNDSLCKRALVRMIEKNPDCIVEASFSCGEDAVDYCRQNIPDVMIIDVKQPGMSGLETARIIRTMHPAMEICLLSAYQSLQMVRTALCLNIRNYFRKPVSPSSLEEALSAKEREPSDHSSLIRTIEQIVESNDFRRVHDDTPGIAEKIIELSGGRNDRAEEILRSVSVRLLSLYLENPFGEDSVLNRFSLDVNFLDDEFLIEMWLCNFLDYLFKHRFIERYESVRGVFQYIDDHIREDFNIQSLIKSCSISQQYLLRLFKERMSMSTFDYIQNRKMILAKWYLSFDEYSTLDVAMTLGYGSGGYFAKVFKKYEGITPHKYKISAREKRRSVLPDSGKNPGKDPGKPV